MAYLCVKLIIDNNCTMLINNNKCIHLFDVDDEKINMGWFDWITGDIK